MAPTEHEGDKMAEREEYVPQVVDRTSEDVLGENAFLDGEKSLFSCARHEECDALSYCNVNQGIEE